MGFFWLFLQMDVIEKWCVVLLPCPCILVSYLGAGVKGQGGSAGGQIAVGDNQSAFCSGLT